jgi:hypothetical protein
MVRQIAFNLVNWKSQIVKRLIKFNTFKLWFKEGSWMKKPKKMQIVREKIQNFVDAKLIPINIEISHGISDSNTAEIRKNSLFCFKCVLPHEKRSFYPYKIIMELHSTLPVFFSISQWQKLPCNVIKKQFAELITVIFYFFRPRAITMKILGESSAQLFYACWNLSS